MGTCVEDISASSSKRGDNGQQRYNYDDLDEGDVDTEGAMPTSTLKTTERAMGHGCLIRVAFLAVHADAVEWGGGGEHVVFGSNGDFCRHVGNRAHSQDDMDIEPSLIASELADPVKKRSREWTAEKQLVHQFICFFTSISCSFSYVMVV